MVVGVHWRTLSLEACLKTTEKDMAEMRSLGDLKAEVVQCLQENTVV